MTPEEVRECMSEYDVDNGTLETLRVPSVARGAGTDVTVWCGFHFAEGVALFCLYAFVEAALDAMLLYFSSTGMVSMHCSC
jgi:hypothetical protein